MKTPKQYNIAPAKGQALLNFQGRRFPDKIDVFETELLEEVRNTKEKDLFDKETDLNSGFRNLLISGDCLSACAYLKQQNIKVDLVYIDPPFASGANYAKKLYLRNGKTFNRDEFENDTSSIGEEVMYGDIWQKEDYLNWLYERLLLIKDILSENSNIFVHLDWRIGHYAKILLDEVFGEESFQNEIIWHFRTYQGQVKDYYPRKHNNIFWYKLGDNNTFHLTYSYDYEQTVDYQRWKKFLVNGNEIRGNNYPKDDSRFTGYYDRWVKENNRKPTRDDIIMKVQGYVVDDVWTDVQAIDPKDEKEHQNYITQKPESILKRIIKTGTDQGMIVADFFSGSGTTAKVANDLDRKFIACDIGINALQTTRDRLVKAGASFDVLKIQDGLRLFRNPAQTTAKILSIIDGFKSQTELKLNDFWDGGIAQPKGTYSPVKFSGIHDKLTKELLDVYLEEIYKLEDTTNEAHEVIIIYAHKDFEIDQEYLNRQLNKTAKTELNVKLVSLDDLLGEKRDTLFTPDNADIKISKKVFSIIDGFKSQKELNLNDFWDGGIAQPKGIYSPVKFSGIHDKLTKDLLDGYLEEIYKLEDTTNEAHEVIIIYAHKDFEIDQEYLNKQLNKTAKTELNVKLISLDDLLGEKRDALFTPDNADIKISKQGSKCKVEIKKFFSPYLKNKIDDYNAKKTRIGTLEQDLSKAVKISSSGLELIEAVQFDTTLKKVWKSNLDLEDKAGIKDKIKGTYTLDTDKFKMKIRNIAGDEIIIDSEEKNT